jgi:hypothetical protein
MTGFGVGLSEEGAPADGGESGCAGAGGVEKGGLLAALQAKGLREGALDHAAFPKGKAVGEVGPLYSPESCEAGICGGSAVGGGA